MTIIDTLPQLSPTNEYDTETLAYAVWSLISEPNDRAAGALIAEVGVIDALRLMTGQQHHTDETTDLVERIKPRLNSAAFTQAMTAAQRLGVTLITPTSPDWPTQLNDLGDSRPHALWIRGDRANLSHLMQHRTVSAIVGARAATGYGEHVTMELAAGLADRGHTILSGAAYGVDGMAHRATLASRGTTVAVLAGGVDRFYPSGHDALLTRIIETGLVISELPCGVAPTKWRFLARNRIVAALSARVIIPEAGWRSGSLNTASHAFTLNRPVGAVPGPVTSAASAGCHRLIREMGATLITNAEEAAEL